MDSTLLPAQPAQFSDDSPAPLIAESNIHETAVVCVDVAEVCFLELLES